MIKHKEVKSSHEINLRVQSHLKASDYLQVWGHRC